MFTGTAQFESVVGCWCGDYFQLVGEAREFLGLEVVFACWVGLVGDGEGGWVEIAHEAVFGVAVEEVYYVFIHLIDILVLIVMKI